MASVIYCNESSRSNNALLGKVLNLAPAVNITTRIPVQVELWSSQQFKSANVGAGVHAFMYLDKDDMITNDQVITHLTSLSIPPVVKPEVAMTTHNGPVSDDRPEEGESITGHRNRIMGHYAGKADLASGSGNGGGMSTKPFAKGASSNMVSGAGGTPMRTTKYDNKVAQIAHLASSSPESMITDYASTMQNKIGSS